MYIRTRLVKGRAKQGYYAYLTELLGQVEVEYKTVTKQGQENLA